MMRGKNIMCLYDNESLKNISHVYNFKEIKQTSWVGSGPKDPARLKHAFIEKVKKIRLFNNLIPKINSVKTYFPK